MDKIDNLKNYFNFKSQTKKRKAKLENVEKNDFSKTIKPIMEKKETDFNLEEEKENGDNLSVLLDEVYKKGDELKKSPTLYTIKEYKWSVKKLLKNITDKMLKLEEKTSGLNILKRKRFTLIQVIDKKLEALAAEVLRAQNEQIKILSRVDEINGLLIDLLS